MHAPQPNPPLRSEFASDPDMMELVELYVEDMPERIAAMRTCWETADGEELRRLAHQLKGASAGYGFPSVGEVARELETVLKEDPAVELERIRREFDALVDECSRVSL